MACVESDADPLVVTDRMLGREPCAQLRDRACAAVPASSNAGTASRAVYGAPMLAFSTDPRADWRLSGRIYVGLRSLRFMGFSPSVSYTYSINALTLHDNRRSRFAFSLARYF